MAVFATVFFFLPLAALAATTISFNAGDSTVSKGDTFVVDVEISTPDKSINVVDGTVIYDNDKLEIKEVSTGGSLLVLWPKSPVFSNEKGNLNFVGGTPGGFQGEKGEIVKIIFLAKGEGEAKLDFLDGFSVFLNDGKGTPINPWLRPLSLNISKKSPEIPAKDEWQSLIEKDKIPPEPFKITLGKESSIFNGQYFINFFTNDAESGVAYYEVQEGKKDFVRAESPYLLQDQSLQNLIKVKAVDKAGNERIEKLTPSAAVSFYKNILFWIITIVIMVIIATKVIWQRKKNF